MMSPAADDDDDFIVQSVVETGASDDCSSSAFGWTGLKKLGGFVFLKSSAADGRSGGDQAQKHDEPEPVLPPGFSAIVNAEEEQIYPAEVKIKVLVAEGNLTGTNRRQAAELHQALQQVVGAAAIYNHLLTKHGGAGTKRRQSGGETTTAGGPSGGIGRSSPCGCGGGVGSCKAISALLKEELGKVIAAAENERQGALLKRFRRVERRSGGLCNPDLLEKVVRSSSTDVNGAGIPASPSRTTSLASLPPTTGEPQNRRSLRMSASASVGDGLAVGLGQPLPGTSTGGFPVEGSSVADAGIGSSGSSSSNNNVGADVPWADDMLCGASRRRNAAMLKTRGRALAKALTRLLKGVSKDLQGVASRLPPWEEDQEVVECNYDDVPRQGPLHEHGRTQSRSSFVSVDTNDSCPLDRLCDPAALVLAPSTSGGGAAKISRTSSFKGSDAERARSRKVDWKLDAQELSFIRKEEERVMKPHVLAKLLAAGAALDCPLQQADFWDVFARLEVATRTEALLNIAIRGGRGCAARSGRMGRELCLSLTSVVLEAISTVERDPSRFNSARSQPPPPPEQPQQMQPGTDSACGEPPSRSPLPRQPRASPGASADADASAEERKRPSSARLSRGSITAELDRMTAEGAAAGAAGTARAARPRAESVSVCSASPHGRRVARGEKVGGGRPVGRYKEDPGLADLDAREEEFRKAIYVDRSALANRLLELTHDAPLCAKVLGTFVHDDVGSAGHDGDHGPWTTGGAHSSSMSVFATAPLGSTSDRSAKLDPATWGPYGAEDGQDKGEDSSGCESDRRNSHESCGSQPSPPVSMTSTDPLSEETDDAVGWNQGQRSDSDDALPSAPSNSGPIEDTGEIVSGEGGGSGETEAQSETPSF